MKNFSALLKKFSMRNLVQQLAQKDAKTRTRAMFGLDIALFFSQALLIMRAFAMIPPAGATVPLGQALAPFVVIVMIVLMAANIEKMHTKLRRELSTGIQIERPLSLVLMGPNMTALFLNADISAGLLPLWLISFSNLGIVLVAGIALMLQLATGEESNRGGVNHNEVIEGSQYRADHLLSC